jgi:hypothetical protein
MNPVSAYDDSLPNRRTIISPFSFSETKLYLFSAEPMENGEFPPGGETLFSVVNRLALRRDYNTPESGWQKGRTVLKRSCARISEPGPDVIE